MNLAQRMRVVSKMGFDQDALCDVRDTSNQGGGGKKKRGSLSAGIVGSNMSCHRSNRVCLELGSVSCLQP